MKVMIEMTVVVVMRMMMLVAILLMKVQLCIYLPIYMTVY